MTVRGDSFGEGTNHYECNACKEPCDWTDSQTSKPTSDPTLLDSDRNLVKEVMDREQLTYDIYKAMQIPSLSERHDAIKALIATTVNEVIGENEPYEKELFKRTDDDVKNYFRNKLRAEQRLKLQEMLK
jgi:hypothetical protein